VGAVSNPTTDNSDLVDIRYLLRLWLFWSWLAVLFGIVGAYIGVQDAENFVPRYKATMVVMPEWGAEKINVAASRVSSVLGLSAGGSAQSSSFERLKVMVGSVALAETLQDRYGLMQIVFAGSWDPNASQWIPPDPEAYRKNYRFRDWFGLWIPEWHEPDLETLARFLEGTVTFGKKPGTQFSQVTVSNRDPEMALFLLHTVYQAADDALRSQDLKESRERRRSITRQLAQADLVDARQSLIGLLTGEERSAILLESDLPYAARIIGPAYVSSLPDDLNLVRVVGYPAAVGALLGLILVTLVGLFLKGGSTRSMVRGS